MRALMLILTGLSVPGAVQAASIEDAPSGAGHNGSVVTMSCSHCPLLKPVRDMSYIVPDIAPGTETIEVKTIDGEVKLVRTEAWLGGSPVVFINKASTEAIKAAEATATSADAQIARADEEATSPSAVKDSASVATIDMSSRTGSLETASAGTAITPQDNASHEVVLQKFELRLN